MERVDISHNSDVALIVEDKLELRVSSVVLCNTSSVFKSMLSSKWPEGRNLQQATSTAPVQIQLQDDDGGAMSLLAAILHQRMDLVQDTVSVNELCQLAVVADKYDCTATLKHIINTFFNAFNDMELVKAPVQIAEAAYKLNHPQAFASITDLLVKREWAKQLDDHKLQASSPLKGIRGFMSQAETDAVKALQLTIGGIAARAVQHMVPGHNAWSHGSRSLHYSNKCSARKDLAIKCLDKMYAADVWMVNGKVVNTKLGTLLALIASLHMPDIDMSKTCQNSPCPEVCHDFIEDMTSRVDMLKKEARDISAGVCLDCFKMKTAGGGKCRIMH